MMDSSFLPRDVQQSLQCGKNAQGEGNTLKAIRFYQKGLVSLLKWKNSQNCSSDISHSTEIKRQSQAFIQSLNDCILDHASLLGNADGDDKSSSQDPISLSQTQDCFPCGDHCNQIFKNQLHRANHLIRVQKTIDALRLTQQIPSEKKSHSPLEREQRSFIRKKPLKIKTPLCNMSHEHIFFSETFKTIEAAHQFMIDSGLRTLYRTRSSNSVGAIYVCKHSNKDYECKKKKKDKDCSVSIKISTKLISRSQGDRFFIVNGCLNHDHDIKDSRLSPSILKLMNCKVVSPSRVSPVETNNDESAIESIYVDDSRGLEHNNHVIVEYESDEGGKRTEIYVPFISNEIEGDNIMSEAPHYVQEITLEESSIKEHSLHKNSPQEETLIGNEWVNQVLPCNQCSKVFFNESSLLDHKCFNSSNDKELFCLIEEGQNNHIHQFIDRSFDSMDAALEYLKSQELHAYFLEQFKRKDFIVYQCSKGVHPDRTSLKNNECPATFTIKASPSSKYVLQGCLTHNHETQPQLLKYLTKSFKRNHYGSHSLSFTNEIEEFDDKKEYATNLLIGTIQYIKGLKYSTSEDKTVNAIIKGTANAVNPRLILGDLIKKKKES
uniref:C2H2-type domain-containing protein n=1 Tax=Lepeophtheirus salmonis TaxID=72036 RepID=A0A0K2TAL1_LEPSM